VPNNLGGLLRQPPAPHLRPLSFGEVVDVAGKLYRSLFGTLVRAVVFVILPVQVVTALMQSGFNGGIAASLASAIMSSIGGALATAACLRALSVGYLGGTTEWRESLAFAWHRLGSVLLVTILVAVLATLALILLIIPGIYLYICWIVAVPVVLLEDLRGRQALKRSRQLVTGRWWPTFGAYALATIIVSILVGVVTGIAAAAVGGGTGFAAAIVRAVAGTIAGSITTPILAAVTLVIYVDLRVRKEGFDLMLLAEGMDQPPTAYGNQAPIWPPMPPGPQWQPPDPGDRAPVDQPYWPPPGEPPVQ
jgi:hypothetical protein